jgi:hypothetical protein
VLRARRRLSISIRVIEWARRAPWLPLLIGIVFAATMGGTARAAPVLSGATPDEAAVIQDALAVFDTAELRPVLSITVVPDAVCAGMTTRVSSSPDVVDTIQVSLSQDCQDRLPDMIIHEACHVVAGTEAGVPLPPSEWHGLRWQSCYNARRAEWAGRHGG